MPPPDSRVSAPEGTDTRHDAQVDSPDLTGPYAAACNIYADLGWRGVIPVDPRDKGGVPAGFTGYGGIDVTPENMAWFAKSKPGHNIGLRLPDGVIGIDVDAYGPKKGADTFAEAQGRWGALPPSYRSTSRDDGISGIRLYRVPAGTKLETIIEFKDLDIRDIEIVQRHHRHVQCWPSIHDKTGQRYRWVSELDGSAMDTPPAPDDLPNLPAAWVAALRAESGSNGTPLNGAEAPVDVQTALTEGDASPRVAELLARAIGDCYGGSRFDHTRGNVLTLLRFGKQGDTGVRPALSALKAVYVNAVSPDRAGGQRAAEVEFDRLVSGKKVATLLAEPDYNDWVSDLAPANAADIAAPELPADDGRAPAATGWEPVDLGPWLRGEIELPTPSLGIARSDGLRLLYPGHEHAVIGETEAGKSWLALQCAAVELRADNAVVYVHFEEGNPSSTIERLRLLGVDIETMTRRLRFVAPSRALADAEWLAALLRDPTPTLVVLDGVNEGMALHGLDIFAADGAAQFRRVLVAPAIRVGAAVLSCDHLPKSRDGQGRDAYGSVHKGNALDGARFVLENVTPFGRGMRGASNVYVTKDRPGHLRSHGRPSKLAGKTYLGTLVADDSEPFQPFSLTLYAPQDDEESPTQQAAAKLTDAVYDVIAAQPDRTVRSTRDLYAAMRAAGHAQRNSAFRDALDDLLAAGRIEEVSGARRLGYRAVATVSQECTA
uniref:DNA primase/polymerase bifunctional N-terminal domain-containing protein n=1 Tax=Mycobacterium sp. (strain KMS) TaxID=189918 RepID=A1UIV2_MYCSK